MRVEDALGIERRDLGGVDAADSHLDDRAALARPGHDAGVVVGRAVIAVAGVAVGVDLEDAQSREALRCRVDRADRHRVVAAHEDRQAAAVEPPPHRRRHPRRQLLRRAVEGERLERRDPPPKRLARRLEIPGFDVGRGLQHRLGAAVGAALPARAAVVGHRQDHRRRRLRVAKAGLELEKHPLGIAPRRHGRTITHRATAKERLLETKARGW